MIFILIKSKFLIIASSSSSLIDLLFYRDDGQLEVEFHFIVNNMGLRQCSTIFKANWCKSLHWQTDVPWLHTNTKLCLVYEACKFNFFLLKLVKMSITTLPTIDAAFVKSIYNRCLLYQHKKASAWILK